jgi:hypothetical protein
MDIPMCSQLSFFFLCHRIRIICIFTPLVSRILAQALILWFQGSLKAMSRQNFKDKTAEFLCILSYSSLTIWLKKIIKLTRMNFLWGMCGTIRIAPRTLDLGKRSYWSTSLPSHCPFSEEPLYFLIGSWMWARVSLDALKKRKLIFFPLNRV